MLDEGELERVVLDEVELKVPPLDEDGEVEWIRGEA